MTGSADAEVRISRNYRVRDWTALSFDHPDDWDTAIAIFEDRIQSRYLDIVSLIAIKEGAGFAILALDCLLIETLQQFREGKACTPGGQSASYFVRFLTETAFGQYFTEDTARLFYKSFRCGILHQAETLTGSRIVAGRRFGLVTPTPDGTGLIINRTLFHNLMTQVFSGHLAELRNPANEALRANFRKKMNHICRVPASL
jgi:hypothetical protein